MIIIYNPYGFASLGTGIGAMMLYISIKGGSGSTIPFILLGGLTFVIDMAIRLSGRHKTRKFKTQAMQRRNAAPGLVGRLFFPSAGGHFFFLPCWLIGTAILVLMVATPLILRGSDDSLDHTMESGIGK